MTDSLIAAARALSDAATPGKWENAEDLVPCGKALVAASNREVSLLSTLYDNENDGLAIFEKRADAVFAARARTLVPQLCDSLEAALARLANACEMLSHFDNLDVEFAQAVKLLRDAMWNLRKKGATVEADTISAWLLTLEKVRSI